jgi:hypothetical protein
MSSHHNAVGISLFVLTLLLLGAQYARAPRQKPLPAWGWVGLAIILVAEFFLFRHSQWVSIYFTPLAWTGYLLLIDGLVWSLRGQSCLSSTPRDFLALAFWSFPLWLVFEAYNWHLKNWTYTGLPDNLFLQGLGYVWSFATIWPAIFETADFLQAIGFFAPQGKFRLAFPGAAQVCMVILGLLSVSVPVLLPMRVGQYLFGPVWVGFIFLLDPINDRWGGRSLVRELGIGRTSTLYSFLASGLVCGIIWEFWNNWAAARWLYVFPLWQEWKIFEMPAPGFLGFPPFALECFVMYEFLRAARGQLLGFRRGPEMQVAGSQLRGRFMNRPD